MQEPRHGPGNTKGAPEENQALVILSKNTLDRAKRELNQGTSRARVPEKSRTPGDQSPIPDEIEGLSPMSGSPHRLNGVMDGTFAQESQIWQQREQAALVVEEAEQKKLFVKQQQLVYHQMCMAQVEAQRQGLAVKAGFNVGYNVKQWKSPYAHRAECKKAKTQNVQQSRLFNQEKSVNAANNTSIFFNDNQRK